LEDGSVVRRRGREMRAGHKARAVWRGSHTRTQEKRMETEAKIS
jgi:hypothetical protein